MSIADKKRLENLEDYLEAEREVDRLWNKPDDGRLDKLMLLMMQYEILNEETLTQLTDTESLLPAEDDDDVFWDEQWVRDIYGPS